MFATSYCCRVSRATAILLMLAFATSGTTTCLAEVVESGNGEAAYIVLSPTTRSRAEVMKSIAEWQTSKLSDSPDASIASWSADNGLLTEHESGDAKSSRIKLNDLDIKSLRAKVAENWQIRAGSISGHGTGFVGQLRADEQTSKAVALQALQDIYDLAYFAQQIATAKTPCDFGELGQYRIQTAHDNTNLWSDVRHPASGKTADAQVLYALADLVHGPTAEGGQTISFAVQSFVNDPVRVEFDVDLTSNMGLKARYHLAEAVANPAAPVTLGSNALMSREPFEAGQCIARVTFDNVVVLPLAVAKADSRRPTVVGAKALSPATALPVIAAPSLAAGPGESQPPFGKKVPSILPLPTTPSLDDACPYPKAARARGETGVVMLLVHVAPDGSAFETAVDQSSGSESLDQATAACVKTSGRFAIRRAGSQAISYWGRMKFNWGFGD
jgi:TonB family protein